MWRIQLWWTFAPMNDVLHFKRRCGWVLSRVHIVPGSENVTGEKGTGILPTLILWGEMLRIGSKLIFSLDAAVWHSVVLNSLH